MRYCSALEKIDFRHVDGTAVAEIDDDDGESDGGLGRRDGQREDLANEIGVERGEGNEIEVHREQHQLDAHQADDDVLAVPEDAEDAEREQDCRHCEVMREADGHLRPLPDSTWTNSTPSSRVRPTCAATD